MELLHEDLLISASELIKDRFYFVSLRKEKLLKSTNITHYFNVDNELCYQNFYKDFGPLNISLLYHYCVKMNKKLQCSSLQKKKIVHYTCYGDQKRANAAYLACSFMIIYHDYTPKHIHELLLMGNIEPYIDFRDASIGRRFTITLMDCLSAIYKAHNLGLFCFEDFDFMEYEHYERVENGDLNWIVPGKLIGFCGPQNQSLIENGYPLHSPETYFSYFRRNNITTIVRLNKKMYDASKFTKAGFDHKDLYFVDGSTPSDQILNNFLSICEKTKGAVAVHCKAGLGRTGSLIGGYIMKHYKLTAHETIAWVRITRPGSIIGHQQTWLRNKQSILWAAGERYRARLKIAEPLTHSKGIYSYTYASEVSKKLGRRNGGVCGILEKVDTMKLEDKDSFEEEISESLTQGDYLNQIKSLRRSQRFTIGRTSDRRTSSRKTTITPTGTSSAVSNTKNRLKIGKVYRGWIHSKEITQNKLDVSSCGGLKVVKRGKRSLTLEKEKVSARTVKALRRSCLKTTDTSDNNLSNLQYVTELAKCP